MFVICSEKPDEDTSGAQFLPAQGCRINKPENIRVYGEETTSVLCCVTTLFLKTLLNHPWADPAANFVNSWHPEAKLSFHPAGVCVTEPIFLTS